MNFESGRNTKHWDPRTYTSEIRPIVGWHLKPWDIIINPIMDNSWYGGFKSLEFVPAERVAYNINENVAVEEYADTDNFALLFQRENSSKAGTSDRIGHP